MVKIEVGDRVRFRNGSARGIRSNHEFVVDRMSAITGNLSLRAAAGQPPEARNAVAGCLFEPRDLTLVARPVLDAGPFKAQDRETFFGDSLFFVEAVKPPKAKSPVPAAAELVNRAAQTFADAKANLKRARAHEAEKQAQERREAAAKARVAAEAEKAATARAARFKKLSYYNALLAATKTALAQVTMLEDGRAPGMEHILADFKAELSPLVAEFGYKIVTANGQGTIAR